MNARKRVAVSFHVKRRAVSTPARRQPLAERRVVEQPPDSSRERPRIPRGHEERIDFVDRVFGDAAGIRQDARNPARHALEPDEAEALEERRVDHDVHRRKELRHRLSLQRSEVFVPEAGRAGRHRRVSEEDDLDVGPVRDLGERGKKEPHAAPFVVPQHGRDADGRSRRPVPPWVVHVGIRADRDGGRGVSVARLDLARDPG